MKNAIELIRVSTAEQAGEHRAGIPAQRETNRRTAQAHGLKIVRTIEIIDVSGASVLQSPEMSSLLQMMESADIHGVVAKEFSRLMRPENFADYALLQHFIDTRTVLYLPEGPIDFASKTGRLYGTIRAAMAGLERREIVERMMDAKESMRRNGKHAGGSSNLPLGIGYSRERGWFYTAEAEKVKELFRLFISGETSYTKISRKLNLPRTNVRYILENPIYTGWRVYDEKRDLSTSGYVSRPNARQGYRRKVQRDTDEVIRVRVLSGLVSEKDFARVQNVIDLKRRKHWRVRADTAHRYTYHGFLVCGACSELLYTHSSKQDFYGCKTRHTRERRRRELIGLAPCDNRYMLRSKLEPKLDSLLSERLQRPDFLRQMIDEHCSAVENPAPIANLDSVTLKLRVLREKRQRILEAFFDGLLDRSARDERIAEADREISTYESLLVSAAPREQFCVPDVDSILEVLEPFGEWEFLSRDDKRSLLTALCPEIAVDRYIVRSVTLNVSQKTHACYEASQGKMAR